MHCLIDSTMPAAFACRTHCLPYFPLNSLSTIGLVAGPLILALGLLLFYFAGVGVIPMSCLVALGGGVLTTSLLVKLKQCLKKPESEKPHIGLKKPESEKPHIVDNGGAILEKESLKKFYEDKHIIRGDESIEISVVDSLDLDLSASIEVELPINPPFGTEFEKQTVTLREVAVRVVQEINDAIKENIDAESIKIRRLIRLDVSLYPMRGFIDLGLPTEDFAVSQEQFDQRWVILIIQALIKNKHIFDLDQINPYVLNIQA